MKNNVFLFALIPLCLFSQHSVNGTFSPATDYTYAFLYHATPTSTDYVDRAQIDAEGNFSIPMDSKLTSGIYKIIYALPAEENNFDFIYNGKESVTLTFSTDKGLTFTDSEENKLWSSYTNSMEMINQTISNYYTQKSTDKKAFKDIFKTLKDTQTAFEETAKGTLASTFIKANSPYIPNEYEDLSTYSSNLKRTFLDHVDFSNFLLQSSDFLIDRVMAYIFGMSASTSNDVYKNDVDIVASKIPDNEPELKTMLLQMVWSRFKSMENPEVANYIADTYLIALSQAIKHNALTDELISYKNNAIGKTAQNFDIPITKDGVTTTTTLHDLDIANQYLIVFWSSTCGHCIEELPKVRTLMESKPNTKVIAIGLEDDEYTWKEAITHFSDFVHVLGLGKWNNPISDIYGISATPTYLLLDKDKTIIAKPDDYEALEKAMD